MKRANLEDIYGLSPLQQGMLFHFLEAGRQGIYFEQPVFWLDGPLDAAAFERAWQRVVDRHPVLRTAFVWEGVREPVQVVHRKVEVRVETLDWQDTAGEDALRERLARFLEEDQRRGFDLTQAPLARFHLIGAGEQRHIFVWSYPHLLLDGWSLPLVLGEVFAFYEAFRRGEDRHLPQPRPYRDYILWLRQRDPSAAEAWWRRTLAGLPGPTRLALAARGAATGKLAERELVLEPAAGAALQARARDLRVTLSTLAHGAWALLLGRYAGEDDVVFGSTVSGRPAELPGVEKMVGLFINTVPVRVRFSGAERAAAWLRRLQEEQNELRQHEHAPLIDVQRWSGAAPGQPLFETLLVFENYPVSASAESGQGSGLRLRRREIEERTHLPLVLVVVPGSRLTLRVTYDRGRFDAESMDRLLGHLATLLAGFVAGEDRPLADLPLLTEAERRQLLEGGPLLDPHEPFLLHRRFEEQATRSPEAVALVFEGHPLTYRELNARADRLAAALRGLGVGPETRVALFLDRSTELVEAILGVLKAGGAYVPIDPAAPAERVAYLLEDSGAAVLVTRSDIPVDIPRLRLDQLLPEGPETGPEANSENAAYVIYTSGSTGRPKGVVVTHANVSRLMARTEAWFGFGPDDVWTLFHSYAFDFSVWEIWGALLYGGRLAVVPYLTSRSPEAFAELLRRECVTVLNQTPSAFRQLLGMDTHGLDLRWVIFGGEALELQSLAPWFARHGDERPRLVNMYGITETTVHVTFRPVSRADLERAAGSVLGLPIPDLRVSLLDRDGQPVPAGVAGEIHVGGAGLARGYLDRPALTAERFVPDPWAAEPGSRLYRSGDLARRTPGDLEYLGRADHQVKLRGFRIELGEIESALARHPGVREALVLAREDQPGDRRLVAYAVPAETAPGASALRDFLAAALPDYMVPAAFVFLPALPLTGNGKVDRRALPAPEAAQGSLDEAAAPLRPVEELIAGIWSQVLGVEGIGAGDDFFQLGGHSLLATQVVSRVRETLRVELPLRQLFDTPTVGELAAAVEETLAAGRQLDLPPLERIPRDGDLPLSFAQERLWFLARLGTATYNVYGALRMSGALEVPALRAALDEVVRRHEVLRTTFAAPAGRPVPVIHPPAPLPQPLVDLSALDETRREAALRELALAEARRRFDLEAGPLLRTLLLRLAPAAPAEHALLFTLHHIVADGWSLGVLVREVSRLYRAFLARTPAGLPELPVQYADFAAWQRSWLRGEVLERQLDWWRRQLAGAPERLELPTDRPRPAVPRHEGARRSFAVAPEVRRGLEILARRQGATLFMVLLGAFDVWLGRHSGQSDVLVGSPIANRTRVETEGLIGVFVNTLVLRGDLAGDPAFAQLVPRLRDATLGAYAHQDVPFEKLVEELRPSRAVSHSPLFQVMLVLQNVPRRALELPGLHLGLLNVDDRAAMFDLTLDLSVGEEGIAGSLQYRRDLFDDATAELFAARFEALLRGIAADPALRLSDLPLLAPGEREQVLAAWNATGEPFPDGALAHELFEAHAARTPDAPAAVFGSESLTYRELERRANRLARHLRRMGVGPEVPVGIHLERSLDAPIAILGILKAGGAFLPLDPSYPAERLDFMIRDSGVPVILSQAHLEPPASAARVVRLDDPETVRRIAAEREERLSRAAFPESLAYVIYTSGSTGRPKGVQLAHRGLCNKTNVFAGSLDAVRPGERVLQFASLSFDASVSEYFMALGSGAVLALPEPGTLLAGTELLRVLRDGRIAAVTLPPSVLAGVPLAELPELRVLILAGEACPPDLVDRWAPGRRCVNAYGPTETTVCATTAECAAGGGKPPIGRPIGNVRVYLVDATLQPVPPGSPGELLIGGAGLARGYLGRPELTAERFVPDPWSGQPGARLYRTGDLARHRRHGDLEFLGRVDQQVKLRGFRIEPGEIEARLRSLPGVRDAAVVPVAGERLAAYWVGDAALSAEELREALRASLPAYMVPSAFVRLEALPRTPSGKLDRRAVRSGLPGAGEARPAARREEPRSGLERTIAEIWRDLLQVESVGLDDNFFDLGGHSLLLVQAHARLQEATGRELPLVELFWYPTVGALAKHLSPGQEVGHERPGSRRASSRREALREPASGIAIVGMAGRFPGARNLDEFWRNLAGGVEGVTFFSDEELEAAGVPAAALRDPAYVKAKGVLQDADLFDAALFGFTPQEAQMTDPQHRVALECAWEALESAGCDPETAGVSIGVFAGAAMNSYLGNLWSNPAFRRSTDAFLTILANDKDFLPTRISYKLNLRGPSLNVQTACSTALVAVHLACQSLVLGECDLALAGGVSVTAPRKNGYRYQEGGILSPDGHCRAFDERAQGTVSGEGVGMVVLKRLADALADGDSIWAVIRGSALNNDGSGKVGFTAPSVEGQADVIGQALDMAGVDAGTIGHVEAHGTGTMLGDPIEVAALREAFRQRTDRRGFCALGSVKTNIGHADAAAGAAGLIKSVLALRHGILPPTLHFERPNPKIDFADSPFYVSAEAREWPADGGPRRAGVSAFGLGGTNAHVVLEEAPAPSPSGPARPGQLLVLSAHDAGALEAATDRLAAHLREHPEQSLADVAFTAQVGRRQLRHRRVLVCQTPEQDHEDAAAALAGRVPGRVFDGIADRADRPVVFLFPGVGDQYVDMARDLYDTEPLFRGELERCFELFEPRLGVDLRRALYPEERSAAKSGFDLRLLLGRQRKEEAAPLRRTLLAQPAVFAVEVALARLWMSWGIRPVALIGYSLGEYSAACVAGALSLEDAVALVAERARLIDGLEPGAMLAVPLPESEIAPLLDGALCLAATNGPQVSVVSGPAEAVDRLQAELDARGLVSRRLETTHAFHSRMMDPIAGAFAEAVRGVALRPPAIPWISNVTGTWIADAEATDPEHWVRHLRGTVRFAEGLAELLSDPERVLLEVGPGQALSSSARQHPAAGAAAVVLTSLRDAREEAQPDRAVLLRTLGRLWLAGVRVDWPAVHAGEDRRRVALPSYPFQRQRFWIDPGPPQRQESSEPARKAELADWFWVPSWKRTPAPEAAAAGPGEWLVFADRFGVGDRVADRWQRAGRAVVRVRPGDGFLRLAEREYEIDPARPGDYAALLGELAGRPGRIAHFWSLAPDDEPRDPETVQDFGFRSLLWLAQALSAEPVPAPLRLLVVSNGVHPVVGGETLWPEAATVLGACLVIPRELAGVSCRSVDVALPRVPASDRLVDQLAADLASDAVEPMTAWRGAHRWVRGFEPAPWKANPGLPRRVREGGVTLITGGFGGMGLAFADRLARAAGARLALVQRTPLSETSSDPEIRRLLLAVRALEEAGAEVLVLAADVADPDGMRRAVEATRERFGAIHGVIHTAGVGGGGLIQRQDAGRVAAVFAPKLDGTRILADLLAREELDFFVLCSSLASIVGLPERVEYCAANAFLDAFAQERTERGRTFTVSINWDTWTDTGMALDPSGNVVERPGMTSADGAEALFRILDRGAPQVAVSTLALPAVIAKWEAFSPEAALEKLAAARAALPAHPRPQLATPYAAPRDATEESLARVWGELLGIDRIGVHDSFLELGGDSILGLQMVAKARRAGLHLTVAQVFEKPTIAQLAAVSGTGPALRVEQGLVTGPAPLTPVQAWFFELEVPERHHWNQSVLLRLRDSAAAGRLAEVVESLLAHHDALRMRYEPGEDGGWRQVNAGLDGAPAWAWLDLSALPEARRSPALEEAATQVQASLDLPSGPLVRFVLFDIGPGEPPRLLAVAHHLVMDAVSWRVVLEDFETAWRQLGRGAAVDLPPKTTSFQDWALRLAGHARAGAVDDELAYWLAEGRSLVPFLPQDIAAGANTMGSRRSLSTSLSAEETRALLQEVPQLYGTEINDVLLAALAAACAGWTGRGAILVDLEGHGREPLFGDVDLSRTAGWFTTIFPVLLDIGGAADPGEALARVQEQLQAIPRKGIGYGLLRHLSEHAERLRALPRPEILFVYLGQIGQGGQPGDSLLGSAPESGGPQQSPAGIRTHLLEAAGVVSGGRLQMTWAYSGNVHRQRTIEALAEAYLEFLRSLVRHCRSVDEGRYAASHFPKAGLNQAELDALVAGLEIPEV